MYRVLFVLAGFLLLGLCTSIGAYAQDVDETLISDPADVLGQWEYEVPTANLRKQPLLFRGIISILEGPNGLYGNLQEIPLDSPDRPNTLRKLRPGGVLIRLTDVQYSENVLTFSGETAIGGPIRLKVHATVRVEDHEFRGSLSIQGTQDNRLMNETRTIEAIRKGSIPRNRRQHEGE